MTPSVKNVLKNVSGSGIPLSERSMNWEFLGNQNGCRVQAHWEVNAEELTAEVLNNLSSPGVLWTQSKGVQNEKFLERITKQKEFNLSA